MSTGTTGESSKGGGRGAAPIGPPTTFSDTSSSVRKIAIKQYTLDTSQARRTPPTPPPGASIPPAPSCSTLSPSLARLGISSPMSDLRELAKKTAVRHLTRARNIDDNPTDAEQRAPKQRKVSEARPRHLPIPPASTPTTRGPAPYQPHLTPTPSSLRPHCLAKDQLRRWIPASEPLQPASRDGPAEAERERVKDTPGRRTHALRTGRGYSCGTASATRRESPRRAERQQHNPCCQPSSRTWPQPTQAER